MDNNNFVFILGNPRSGTSLLRVLLNSHDEITIPPECGFIQWLSKKYVDWTIDKIDEFIFDLSKTKKIEFWDLNYVELNSFVKKLNPKDFSELCYYIYDFYGKTKNKKVKICGDKNNYYIHHLDEIKTIFPNAKFIHIIRNPFDVISSYKEINKLPDLKYKPIVSNDTKEIIEEWVNNNNKIIKFLKDNNLNFICITYEELITFTDDTLLKISEFLSIDGKKILDNYNQKKYFDEPLDVMIWKKKLSGNIDKNNIKIDKNFTEGEKQIIDKIIKNKKIYFNYYGK